MSTSQQEPAVPRSISSNLSEILRTHPGVSDEYRHIEKSFELQGTLLKWYRLAPQDDPVPEEIDHLARAYLAKAELDAPGLGFAILHRCGTRGFHFLIVSTWRGNNEVWETVFYKKDATTPNFALWPRDAAHKPTFCVWELAAVWHETKAWERFLKSAREQAAAQVWLADRYSGPA